MKLVDYVLMRDKLKSAILIPNQSVSFLDEMEHGRRLAANVGGGFYLVNWWYSRDRSKEACMRLEGNWI